MKKHLFTRLLFIMCMSCCFLQAHSQTGSENVPAKNTARGPLPEGASVVGVFDGRCPCQEMAKLLNVKTIPECIKIKWRLILYQDATTKTPTKYVLEGFVYRNPAREGIWQIIQGTYQDQKALIYKLDPDKPDRSVSLLKGDDNVLFFLDNQMKLMVGNKDFSFTLNRTGPK